MSAYSLLTPEQLKAVLARTSPHSFAFNVRRLHAHGQLHVATLPSLQDEGQPSSIARMHDFRRWLDVEGYQGEDVLFKMRMLSLWPGNAIGYAKLMREARAAYTATELEALAAFERLMETDEEEARKVILVDLAHWLADMLIAVRSEAMKYGLPLEEVVEGLIGSRLELVDAKATIKSILFGLTPSEEQTTTPDPKDPQ